MWRLERQDAVSNSLIRFLIFPDLISIHKKRKSMKSILRKQLENEKALVTNINWFYEKIDKL